MPDKSKPPSFDDIMKAASRPPEPQRKEPQKSAAPPSEPPRRKPSAPTFAEIIGSVQLRPEDRVPRPLPPRRPRKDERKMPEVVRRPALGKPEEPPSPPAPIHEEGAAPEGSAAAGRDQRAVRPLPESAFAEPGADEAGDFAALFAESEKS